MSILMHVRRAALGAAILTLAACGDTDQNLDAGHSGDAGSSVGTDASHAPDAGEDDAGSIELDAGSTEDDAGSIDLDAGTVDLDAGSIDPDAGSIDPDAGSIDPDAGSIDPDAGPAPVPESCTTSTECGPTAECVASTCVCALGHRPCSGGCCPTTVSTVSIPGLWGRESSIAITPDGTVYAAVRQDSEVADPGEMWIRGPGATFSRSHTFVDGDTGGVCLTVRDGIAWLVLAASSGQITIRRADGTGTPTVVGMGFTVGASCVTDAAGAIWIAWIYDRPGPDSVVLDGVSIARDGTRTPFRHLGVGSAGGSSHIDVALDPSTDRPWAFFVDRNGPVLGTSFDLVDGTDGGHRPSDHAVFGAAGEIHSLAYTSYGSSLFSASIDGTLATFRATPALPVSLISSFHRSDIVLGPEGVPYLAGFDDDSRRVYWYAARHADSWSGAGYGNFPLVEPWSHQVVTRGTRAPDGAAAFLSIAPRADLGAAVYAEIR